MPASTIPEKIKKLQAMFRATGPEAANAKRLIEKLIAKYNIKPEDMEKQRKLHKYKVHRLKKFALTLANWMRIPVSFVRYEADYVFIEADEDEYLMFHELLGEIKHIFNKMNRMFQQEAEKEFRNRWREQFGSDQTLERQLPIPSYQDKHVKNIINRNKNIKLQSFMLGYMKANYPFNHNLCTKCYEADVVWNIDHSSCACPNCGTKFRAAGFHSRGHNKNAYDSGYATTTKSLKQKVKAIGYNS